MKKLFLALCIGSFTFIACNRETTGTENTVEHTVETDNTDATANTTDYETESRDRANRLSDRMAADMQLDTATQSRVRQTYYTRAQRQAELQRKYNYQENSQNGGQASDQNSLDRNNGYFEEMEALDVEIDSELRSYLAPAQLKIYEQNRNTYTSELDNIQRKITRDGDEITVETGDIKVKAEPGKSKVETSTYESKIKGDERKFKSKVDDTKIKSEPGEMKYKSGDTKIKIEKED